MKTTKVYIWYSPTKDLIYETNNPCRTSKQGKHDFMLGDLDGNGYMCPDCEGLLKVVFFIES